MTMPLVLGVDGGGTSTVAWLADGEANGRVLGRGSAGPSNAKAIGPDRSRRALREAIAEARGAAGVVEETVEVACLGLAGFDRPEDRALLTSWCEEEGWAHRVEAVNDGDLVLAAGTPDGFGIALIAGTGSISVGRSPDGRTARSGGWGPLFGDEGSGYAVALAGLRLVARRFDGRSDRPESDRLTHFLCRELGAASPRDMVPILYGTDWDRARIAGLARLVVEVADHDRAVIDLILRPAAQELSEVVLAVRGALDWGETIPPLAVAGGFLLASELLREEIGRILADRVGPIGLVPEPVLGAVVLARRALA